MDNVCRYCNTGRPLLEFANEIVDIVGERMYLKRFIDDTLEYEDLDYINIKYCPMCGEKIVR